MKAPYIRLSSTNRRLEDLVWISFDYIDGSDHQKFVGSEAGCKHNHVDLTVIDPCSHFPVFIIHPKPFDRFPKWHIPYKVFNSLMKVTR